MPFSPRPRHTWSLRTRTLNLGERTLVMGILNVTPDSFSDAGQFFAPDLAIEHGLDLLDRGADILDIGAESTRPNAQPLSPTQEQARLLPVLNAIRSSHPHAILSVDTYHGSTALAAIEAGAEIINDVSGLAWDSSMAALLAAGNPPPGVVLMHTRGTPQTWHTLPHLDPNLVQTLVLDDLHAILEKAANAAIPPGNILLDPGFGFGKLGPANFPLLAHLGSLHRLGRPLLVGLSRKRFLAQAPSPTPTGNAQAGSPVPASKRLHATVAANTTAILAGAHIIRVHDVPAAIEAAAVADAILAAL